MPPPRNTAVSTIGTYTF